MLGITAPGRYSLRSEWPVPAAGTVAQHVDMTDKRPAVDGAQTKDAVNDLDRYAALQRQRAQVVNELHQIDQQTADLIHQARPKRRRLITPELLDEALRLHTEGGADLVALTLGVSKSQAFRYIKAARERRTTHQ